MIFKKGDRVVCISEGSYSGLKLGKVFTIRSYENMDGRGHVTLQELGKNTKPYASRFTLAGPRRNLPEWW
jgi:hypothetical protein